STPGSAMTTPDPLAIGPAAPGGGGHGPDPAARPRLAGPLSALRNRRALVGLGLIALIALFCFAGPLIDPTDQVTVHLELAQLPPGAGHPLGTDAAGYDVLGRLMTGGR